MVRTALTCTACGKPIRSGGDLAPELCPNCARAANAGDSGTRLGLSSELVLPGPAPTGSPTEPELDRGWELQPELQKTELGVARDYLLPADEVAIKEAAASKAAATSKVEKPGQPTVTIEPEIATEAEALRSGAAPRPIVPEPSAPVRVKAVRSRRLKITNSPPPARRSQGSRSPMSLVIVVAYLIAAAVLGLALYEFFS